MPDYKLTGVLIMYSIAGENLCLLRGSNVQFHTVNQWYSSGFHFQFSFFKHDPNKGKKYDDDGDDHDDDDDDVDDDDDNDEWWLWLFGAVTTRSPIGRLRESPFSLTFSW